MISTALALQNATQEAVHDEMVMGMASAIFHHRTELTDDDFAKALFEYSALLASLTTTLATNVLLTESQLDELMGTIKEMDSMGKDIESGN